MRSILLSLLLVVLPGAAAAQVPEAAPADEPRDARTVTVSATGSVERDPDRAFLTLAVETAARTAQEAVRGNAAKMEAVLAAIRGFGIPDDRIRSLAVSVNPEYARDRPRDEQPRIVGYRARNAIQVTIDEIARVGEIMDGAVAAGADRVTGLDFGLRDPEAARLEAVADGVRRGAREAAAVAAALGERVGPVLEIRTTAAPIGVPPQARMAVALEALVVTTPIEPGTLTITADITATYRLERP